MRGWKVTPISVLDSPRDSRLPGDSRRSTAGGRCTPAKSLQRFRPKNRLREKSHIQGTRGLKGPASELVANANTLIDFSLESALGHAHQDNAVVIENPQRSWALGLADDMR